MARAKWGPAIGSDEKWRYGPGDIVKIEHGGVIPHCDLDGNLDLDHDGRLTNTLSEDAVCVIIARMPNPPDKIFALVFDDGNPAPPEPKCKCYIVRVLPERSIQPTFFFEHHLGRLFIVKEKKVSQTNKERRMTELGIWNNESGVFDKSRLSELRNRVHEDDMKEKGGSHGGDDR